MLQQAPASTESVVVETEGAELVHEEAVKAERN